MSKLYIINPTKHNQIFGYRMPENIKLIERTIPAGHQLMVYEGDEYLCHFIVDQHQHYGIMSQTDATNLSANQGYLTLMYRIDKPATKEAIEQVMEHNTNERVLQAAEVRAITAAAASNAIDNTQMTERSKLTDFEMEVSEHVTHANANSARVEHKVIVNKGTEQRRR